jgi:hypothetical protein
MKRPHIHPMKKSGKKMDLTKLNMSFISAGCKQNEVETILLTNNKFKI